MSLEQGAGYIRITAPSGAVIMDTRDELFHRLSYLSGTVSVPALTWGPGSSPRSRLATYAIGSVDASCTALLGFCQITWSTGLSLLPSGAWYMIGGTIVPLIKRYQTITGSNGLFISSIQALTFELAGAAVNLTEETVLADDLYAGPSSQMAAQTINYRLYAGTFT